MGSMVGASVLRREDPSLVSGRGTYVEDVRLPGAVHLAVLRSTEAHARIRSVDTKPAAEMPGVLGVWTADDLELPNLPGLPGLERPPMAREKVVFAGEIVAVVVASERAQAVDAAGAVFVDYEPLPTVVTLEEATAEGAPLVFEPAGSNVFFQQQLSENDAEEELSAAPHRVSMRLVNQRVAAAPIEALACVADWTHSGLTFWVTTQNPHHVKNVVAASFGLNGQQIRVVVPDVGGGFGAKVAFYPEYWLAIALSKRLGRPVRFAETRSESLVNMAHGRDQVQQVEVGFDDEGRVLALRLQVTQNSGAWPDPIGVALPSLTCWMSSGCYRIPTISAGFRDVLTNTTPVASYRGAGRPEAAYMIERVMDRVAAELGIDPVEVRRRNFIPPDAFPYFTPFEGIVYDSGDYNAAVDELLRMLDYPKVRAQQQARNADPSQPLMGIGFSTYVELGGVGPSAALEGLGFLAGWESADVRVTPDGSVTVATGLSPHGQGTETTFAQIVADRLQVPMEAIRVVHGDTALVQEGMGTMGSRGMAIGGSAVLQAADKVREKATRIAAHLLEANPDDIEIEDGTFAVRGTPTKSVTMTDVAQAAHKPSRLGEDMELGLEATSYFEAPNFTFPSGAHCCVVGIDRDTGKVTVERFLAVDDCGNMINPLIVEGQIQGGLAQGIAQALYEQISYSDTGQPLTATFVDYLVPAATELPAYETSATVTPTPVNPLGAKGVGESGTIGAPPAVVNAVLDALRPFGVEHIDMPCTPEKVWRAMHAASNGGTT